MNLQVHALVVALAIIVLCGCSENPPSNEGNLPSSTQQADATPPPQHSKESSTESSSFYSVREYDPEANPAKHLTRTVSLASASGKRIILEIGGEW